MTTPRCHLASVTPTTFASYVANVGVDKDRPRNRHDSTSSMKGFPNVTAYNGFNSRNRSGHGEIGAVKSLKGSIRCLATTRNTRNGALRSIIGVKTYCLQQPKRTDSGFFTRRGLDIKVINKDCRLLGSDDIKKSRMQKQGSVKTHLGESPELTKIKTVIALPKLPLRKLNKKCNK